MPYPTERKVQQVWGPERHQDTVPCAVLGKLDSVEVFLRKCQFHSMACKGCGGKADGKMFCYACAGKDGKCIDCGNGSRVFYRCNACIAAEC